VPQSPVPRSLLRRSSFMLLVLATALVTGCAQTADTSPEAANLDQTPPTEQELDAIRDQVIPCWHFPAGVEHSDRYRVAVKIGVTPAGKVMHWEVTADISKLNDPAYPNVLQQAVNAVGDSACQPLHFPPGKYWPRLTIVFDPTKL